MWKFHEVTEETIDRWIWTAGVGVGPGSLTERTVSPALENLRLRLKLSLKEVERRRDLVRDFLDNYFAENPPPGKRVRLAVFAPGSAARLEYLRNLDEPATASTSVIKPESSSDFRSDLDLFFVQQGASRHATYWDNMVKTLLEHLRASGVVLDNQTKLAEVHTVTCLTGTKSQTVKKRLHRTIDEDRRREIWRHWVVFESALLYAYPSGGAGDRFAERLERDLLDDYFNIPADLQCDRFPFIWYHAACRYMSSIYLDTFRQIAAEASALESAENCSDETTEDQDELAGKLERRKRELFEKAIKLKSVRLMTWCATVMNALVAFQLAQRWPSTDIWQAAKVPGIAVSLALQRLLVRDRRNNAKVHEVATNGAGLTEVRERFGQQEPALRDSEDEFEMFRDEMIDAYHRYFDWMESGGAMCEEEVEVCEIYDFLHGIADGESKPISAEMVRLVRNASKYFQKIQRSAAERCGFATDFLFY